MAKEKKVKKRTPGGRIVIHKEKKKPNRAHCGRCHKVLSGVESKIPSVMSKLAKTKKIPQRKYAGVLCSKCLEELLRYKVRFESVYSKKEDFEELEFTRDLTIEKFLAKNWFKELAK